jgi:hypothetical protein
MSLSRRSHIYLEHKCPQCGNVRVNTERWFYAIARYTCEGCGQKVRVTYEAKLKLLTDRGAGGNSPDGLSRRLVNDEADAPPATEE